MSKKLELLLAQLKLAAISFDATSAKRKVKLIEAVERYAVEKTNTLPTYHELLLFMAAHPENRTIQQTVEKALKRITKALRTHPFQEKYLDSGLPFSAMQTRFSHDLLQWMANDKQCALTIDSYEETGTDLNTLLRFTLPSVEREETTAGLDNNELMFKLGIKEKSQLSFLLNEFDRFNATPLLKDHLWESLKVFIHFKFKHFSYSKTWNRLPVSSVFYASEILKQFNHEALIRSALPSPKALQPKECSEVAAIIKRALVLTMRETDPATYMDESSLRLFELERGISIAIYGMKAERQLPFQSYIGYTLFKNGLPAAYGGSWMFGKRAMFGLNIFETYRGGESGFMMCQLLRVYIQVFELDYVEVEAYQFGLDNPDGIRSGAFWFYYRYGFRSLNKALNSLSAKEFQKIKQQKGYRSSEKKLLQFTESNIALKLQPAVHIKHSEIAAGIAKMINVRFGGNRMLSEQKATALFLQKTKMELPSNVNELQVLKEVALWAEAFQIKNKNQLQLMRAMIQLKPIDPYAYNQVIQDFFSVNNV